MLDRLVTVAAFQDPVAANMARNFLESEGITAVIVDEMTVSTLWSVANAIGGIKLQVAPMHVERAEMLLAQVNENRDDEGGIDAEQDDDDDEDLPTLRTAIATQEIAEEMRSEREDKAPINQLVDRLFRVVVLGLLFWPLQFYALWLLLQLTQEPGTVSEGRRWKVWACVLFSPVIVLSLFMVLTCGCPGNMVLP